jgi:hypothetical protein
VRLPRETPEGGQQRVDVFPGAEDGEGGEHAQHQAVQREAVLSSDDPVRVFQQFAALDLISGGRAEIIAGRGSYIESFPAAGSIMPGP